MLCFKDFSFRPVQPLQSPLMRIQSLTQHCNGIEVAEVVNSVDFASRLCQLHVRGGCLKVLIMVIIELMLQGKSFNNSKNFISDSILILNQIKWFQSSLPWADLRILLPQPVWNTTVSFYLCFFLRIPIYTCQLWSLKKYMILSILLPCSQWAFPLKIYFRS